MLAGSGAGGAGFSVAVVVSVVEDELSQLVPAVSSNRKTSGKKRIGWDVTRVSGPLAVGFRVAFTYRLTRKADLYAKALPRLRAGDPRYVFYSSYTQRAPALVSLMSKPCRLNSARRASTVG